MSSKEQLELATNRAINSYCRILELQVKVVEQFGMDPKMATTKLADTVSQASSGLQREVALLRFLREGGDDPADWKGSTDPT